MSDAGQETRRARGQAELAAVGTIEAQLTGPGSPFETVREEVLGTEITVFANRMRSIRELIEHSSAHGNNEYLVFDDGRRFTFDEHLRHVASTAKVLADDHGVGVGSRVAIFAANSPEWIFVHHAVVSLGGLTVAMNGWWTADEVDHALTLTDPALLFTDRKRAERLDGLSIACPRFDLDTDARAMDEAHADAPMPSQPIAEDDPSVILFTSGTTGRPKGAVLSHRTLLGFQQLATYLGARSMMVQAAAAPPPDPDATAPAGGLPVRLAPFPLFHVSGMFSSLLTPLAIGFTTVWPTGRFDPEKVFRLVAEEGVTAIGGAATHIWRLLDHPSFDTTDLSGVSDVGIGGSASTPELIRRTEERLPQTEGSFSSGYGQTENGALVSHATNAMLALSPDSVGVPLATVEVKIVDDAGNQVPDGTDGNIWVRSPLVMLGYWGNNEATDEALPGDRWLVTGDVGRLIDGVLHLASRKRDLIIRGGENIHPGEVENILEEHPAVAEVAVFGVDQRELGQEVKAVVVPAPGTEIDTDELVAFAGEKLAYYKVPTHWEVRTEPMPRNATGKILKNVLRGEGENTFIED